MAQDKKYKLGIVLSGGGARGFAHIGALQALHEADLYPDVISGVSAGAIVGAFYAHGKAPEDILELLKDKGILDYSKLGLPLDGFLSISGLINDLKKNILCNDVGDLDKPAFFATTNLNTGKIEYKNSGNLCKVVAASACIPILFKPVELEGQQYIDGGTFDNFPIKPIKDDCERIIGINISPVNEVGKVEGMLKIAARVFQISVNATAHNSLPLCDLLVEPSDLFNYSILDIDNVKKVYEIGYEATKKALEEADW